MGPGNALRALRRLTTDYPKMLRDLPLDEHLVLLDAQCGRSICGNMFYVARELAENPAYAGLELWISTRHSSRREAAALLADAGLDGRVNLVFRNSRRYFKLLASAKWLFTDTCFPEEWVKRAGQVVANTWHGTPLKCMGRDIREGFQDIDNVRKNLLDADFLSFPSRYAAEAMGGAYMLDEGVGDGGGPTLLFTGYPRNTAFFGDTRREKARARLGVGTARAIAYLPTHRPPRPDAAQPVDFQHVLAGLDSCLGEGQVLFAKLHPIEAARIDFSALAHVRPFPRTLELYETLAACDALLTDYSSVMFDYAVCGRPIVLFAFDEAEYFASRGAYLRLEELPFPKAKTPAAALAALEGTQSGRTAFLERFCPRESPHAASDLCARVIAGVRSPRIVEARLSGVSREARLSGVS